MLIKENSFVNCGDAIFRFQVARKCFAIKEMKRGALSCDGFFLRWREGLRWWWRGQ
ncbi:hypothetical protein LR48_Vigan06g102700 [Vigna angularis]|uniref:Uncharacterized protein n=1 Tax=Phaseolus angularis TaxID=3914 RepID=A0A0L9USM1_PHAAN|nr:hypothetical protein LR48_Vigan06g102700 [Vigna angularis]